MSILHTVLLKSGPSIEAMNGALQTVRALSELPMVEWLRAGPDTSVEGLQNGFTHVVVASFATSADRDAYLEHPAHVKAGSQLGAAVTDLAIVDLSD